MVLTLLPGADPAAGALHERMDRVRAGAEFWRATILHDVPESVGRRVALALIVAALEVALREIAPEPMV